MNWNLLRTRRNIALGLRVFLAAGALAPATAAFAEESQFGYVYTTDLLPKGKREVEQWLTWRIARSQGNFNVLEGRTEFEYGVTDSLQLALYANYAYTHTFHNNIDGTTAPPESFAEKQPDADEHFSAKKFVGVSAEAIYRILSPYKDPVGLAFYIEPTIGDRLRELEARLILQKNFLEDRLILAGNLTWAPEQRALPGEPDADPEDAEFYPRWDKETDINVGLAASYRFIENWSAGMEFLNEREWAEYNPFKSDMRTNSVYYLGPSLHYGGKTFFATGVFLAQLPFASDFANPEPDFVVQGRSNADDFELYRIRLKVGYYF